MLRYCIMQGERMMESYIGTSIVRRSQACQNHYPSAFNIQELVPWPISLCAFEKSEKVIKVMLQLSKAGIRLSTKRTIARMVTALKH